MMRKILIAVVFLMPVFCWAQDAAKWTKARDYLSCRLSLEAIRGKVKADTSIRGRFARVEPVLASISIDAPLSAAALDGTLHEFARVRQVVVEPISRVDPRGFAGLPDGAQRLVDSAFAIVARGYVVDENAKVALRGAVVNYLAPPVVAKAPETTANKKPVIALGGQPDGVAAAPKGRGFDLWVLLPLVLLGVAFVVFRRKYLEVKDELRARKVEMRSFNENYFAKASGTSKASGGDRKDIERAISELNEAIGRLQLRVSQLEGKPAAVAAAAPVVAAAGAGQGSAGAVAPAAKNKLKVAEAPPKAADGADVFYMAGPVNNYFPNSAKSLTKDNTVYRFKVSSNKQDAEFELHTSGAPINEIVQLAESYIKAACDEENLPSYPVKNIVTRKAGQAILEGDKWIIKSKALIRYE